MGTRKGCTKVKTCAKFGRKRKSLYICGKKTKKRVSHRARAPVGPASKALKAEFLV